MALHNKGNLTDICFSIILLPLKKPNEFNRYSYKSQ